MNNSKKIELLGVIVSKENPVVSRNGKLYVRYVIEADNTYWDCLSFDREADFIKKVRIRCKIVVEGYLKKSIVSRSNWRDNGEVLITSTIYFPSPKEISSIKRNCH